MSATPAALVSRILAGAVALPVGVAVALAPTGVAAAAPGASHHAAAHQNPGKGGHHGVRHHHDARHHHKSRHSRRRREITPPRPGHVHVVHVGSSGFTVEFTGSARRYRLFAATKKRRLAVVAIHHGAAHSHLSRHPHLTLRGLHYSTTPYFFRVEAKNGHKRRYSQIHGTVSLAPPTPTGFTATSGSSGLSLSWHDTLAAGYTIKQSTSADMSQGVVTYTTDGADQTFTPYDLTAGSTYYFTVAADNNGTASAPSPVASGVETVDQLPVRMMTYNLLRSDGDGRTESGNVVAPWSQRIAGVVARIQAANPDVIAIEEGGGWSDATQTQRQVDQLVTQLGGEYALADTEIPPGQPHYFRTGVYVLYNASRFTPIGTPGHWALGDTRWAAYQALQDNATGAQFLAVAAHLRFQLGAGDDALRAAETRSLLAQSNAYAATMGGIPVVYGGDWNSDSSKKHESDAVRQVMSAAGIDDAFEVAQSRTNAQYDSANNYQRTPPASGQDIDAIFAPAGVAVSSWGMEMLLDNGQFSGVIPSDHNAVYADLLVPYSPATSPAPPATP